MEYCYHIRAGATQPSRLDWVKMRLRSLVGDYFPPYNRTDETFQVSYYSVAISMPNVQTCYVF